jgi:hypothetical protein
MDRRNQAQRKARAGRNGGGVPQGTISPLVASKPDNGLIRRVRGSNTLRDAQAGLPKDQQRAVEQLWQSARQ